MTRMLALNGLAVAIAAAGLTALARPAAARALLHLPDTEASGYALRIAGAMILASALFLGGFATMYQLVVAS